MKYWKRRYRIVFPDLDYTIEDSLQVDFDIQKDMTAETNKSNITICNMKEDNREKVSASDTKVEVYAGYEGTGGPVCIFKGTVIQSETTYDEHDIKTKLTLSDGQVEVRDTYVSLSYPADTPIDTALKTLANNMGLALEYGDGVSFGSFPVGGYSYAGKAWTAVQNICQGSGITASIQNGIIQLVLDGGVFTQKGLVFGADSGLVGYPERINQANPYADKTTPKKTRKKQQKKEKIEKKAGWRIKTLLAPTVSPGDAVKVKSKVIDGWFRVESIHHRGAYIGGDWISEMDIVEGAV